MSKTETDSTHIVYTLNFLGIHGCPEVWLSHEGCYFLRFDKSNKDDFGQEIITPTDFYLSDNKEKAIEAIIELSNIVKSLQKKQSIEITDFKGNKFKISYLSKKDKWFRIYNPNIVLRNKYGAEFIGAEYTGSWYVLDYVVKKSNKWK